ncbi:MAG: hypothetical protein DMF46_05100 [Verrucomicrobia bacterium]|nr:MAG: hypothetical protein DMF46_05100 [Verrucomicrobiota bacterium]
MIKQNMSILESKMVDGRTASIYGSGGAQAASLFISAACRDALRLRRGDVLEGCRQADDNYRLAACAPQNQLAARKMEA